MTTYTMSRTLPMAYDNAVGRVREQLAANGFGVLTEIDVRATMKNKLDIDVPDQVILGTCRPELAHRAMNAAPSIAALLPCNVVVRALERDVTLVEAIDPDTLVQLDHSPELRDVASDARTRLVSTLDGLDSETSPSHQGDRR